MGRNKIKCVANSAARKLVAAIDTSLIGLLVLLLEVVSLNTAGPPHLDCTAIRVSLENRWLSRRGSMIPGFNIEPISGTVSRTKSRSAYAPLAFNKDEDEDEAEDAFQWRDEEPEQVIQINVSIAQRRPPSVTWQVDPIDAKMSASTFEIQNRHYFLLTFPTLTGRSKRASFVTPIQFHVDEASKKSELQRTRDSTSVSPTTVPFQLKELRWTERIGSLHRSSFNSLRNKPILISTDEKVCIPNKLFMESFGFDAILLKAYDGSEFVSTIEPYDEHFEERLVGEDFPVNDLVRSRANFKARQVGFVHRESGEREGLQC